MASWALVWEGVSITLLSYVPDAGTVRQGQSYLALHALQPEHNLLRGLRLLVEDGLGLTTITALLAIITTLTLAVVLSATARRLESWAGRRRPGAIVGSSLGHRRKGLVVRMGDTYANREAW